MYKEDKQRKIQVSKYIQYVKKDIYIYIYIYILELHFSQLVPVVS